ncbi:MAG TPA: glycosyltransferase [Stellaceae bacterium]|nr:glycosyltransferase [Stellaceae bacterium]
MPADNRIRAVILTVRYGVRASYYEDWLDAFEASPHFAVTAFNLFSRDERRTARRAVADAELVIALHACSADTLSFIEPLRGALQARRGRFLMFIGNEYNLPWIRLADKRGFLRDVAADWVATQLPLEAGEWLYDDTGATVLALPHAANEAVFRRDKPDAARTIDLGGRSFRYPVFLGDDDRNRVYDLFSELGPAAGLNVDIATSSRLARPDWAAFLNECRGTIGTEAGTWYLERDDHTALAIREFLRARSGAPTIRADGWLHAATRHLPYGVKAGLKTLLARTALRHEAFEANDDDFAEVQARFFSGQAPCPAYSKCISSRHFEAAATGTCQILVDGRYNDILQAGEHYVALRPDLGNADAAIEQFRDAAERGRVADAAHALIHDAHTYRHRLDALYGAVTAR